MSIFTTIIVSTSNNLAIIGIYMFLIILNFPQSLCLQEVAQLVVVLCVLELPKSSWKVSAINSPVCIGFL